MKHSVKITIILVAMFFVAQFIGIYVANVYLPETVQIVNETTGEVMNETHYNLPYGFEPPKDVKPETSVFSIVLALFIAVSLMFLLMKIKAEMFLRIWFLVVVVIGIALALNAFFFGFKNSAVVALVFAIPLGILKIFHRNAYLHNFTEMLIYPGIATVFIPLLNIWSVSILLVLISIYDMYAVWHAGFMQKMAKYQIETLKIFSGFFVPYLGKKDKERLRKAKKMQAKKGKPIRMKVNLAILGGGDVVFPILLSGVVLQTFGLMQALLIPFGATLGLSYLFYKSEKGKFYPAMPFISVGCFIALAVIFLV
jgi:presenilin-like A22 family membrane protease